VLITHDRHLIRSVANRIVEVTAGVARAYPGSYDDYLWRKDQEDEQASVPASPRPTRTKADKAELRKLRAAVRRVESELERAHADRQRFEEMLADPMAYTRSAKSDEAMQGHTAAARRVAELESEWERLTDSLEGAE